jgi:hypothetical protein
MSNEDDYHGMMQDLVTGIQAYTHYLPERVAAGDADREEVADVARALSELIQVLEAHKAAVDPT